jgi:hypothetical protein
MSNHVVAPSRRVLPVNVFSARDVVTGRGFPGARQQCRLTPMPSLIYANNRPPDLTDDQDDVALKLAVIAEEQHHGFDVLDLHAVSFELRRDHQSRRQGASGSRIADRIGVARDRRCSREHLDSLFPNIDDLVLFSLASPPEEIGNGLS